MPVLKLIYVSKMSPWKIIISQDFDLGSHFLIFFSGLFMVPISVKVTFLVIWTDDIKKTKLRTETRVDIVQDMP